MRREEYLAAAREFARDALGGRAPPVVIQNAHKAVEFALMVYAMDFKGPTGGLRSFPKATLRRGAWDFWGIYWAKGNNRRG